MASSWLSLLLQQLVCVIDKQRASNGSGNHGNNCISSDLGHRGHHVFFLACTSRVYFACTSVLRRGVLYLLYCRLSSSCQQIHPFSVHYSKVTIRPDFVFGTAPNFDVLSRKNYEVFRDAELSRIPSPVPILSRFECSGTSHVAVENFDGLIVPIPNSLLSDSFLRALNAPNPFLAGPLPGPRWGSV